jgi:hypothetical protein
MSADFTTVFGTTEKTEVELHLCSSEMEREWHTACQMRWADKRKCLLNQAAVGGYTYGIKSALRVQGSEGFPI